MRGSEISLLERRIGKGLDRWTCECWRPDRHRPACVLLRSTPVIIAMATEITDLAANLFARSFYAAIASAQPVGAAVRQGSVALEFAGTNEGWSPSLLARPDVDLDKLVLVKVPPE